MWIFAYGNEPTVSRHKCMIGEHVISGRQESASPFTAFKGHRLSSAP
jgi:hypothetical protein